MKSIPRYKSKTKKAREKRQSPVQQRNRIDEDINQNSPALILKEQGKGQELLKDSGELYRILFNSSNDALFVSVRKSGGNLPGKFLLVNDTACQRLGYSRKELLHMSPLDISAPIPTITDSMERLAVDKRVIHDEIHITKDGRQIPVEISTRSFAINGRQFNLSVARDITERKQAEAALRLQSAALNAAANAIVITDREGTIHWVNQAWSSMTGYSSHEAIGQNPRILKSGLQDEAIYKNLWQTILSGKVWQSELVNKRKDGSLYSEEQTITPVHDASGEITHFIAIKQDISERKRMEEELKQLSIHDTLTGLYNRGFFEEELARLERGRQFPISLVMADVDQLKSINDRLGHSAGDDLLRRAARVLTKSFRSEDIVARIGGDEFAIILPGTDGIVAKKLVRRIRQSLQKDNAEHANIFLGISFGVSTAKKSKPLHATLKAADASMYREKRKPSTS